MADYERAFEFLKKAREIGGAIMGDVPFSESPIPRPPRTIPIPSQRIDRENYSSDQKLHIEPSRSYIKKLTLIQTTELKSTINESIPKYVITHKLGSGGFATVYRAEDNDGKTVAIKLPKFLDGTLDASIFEKFQSEADMWIKLDHENIVMLYENGLEPIPFIAMELMEGGNLKQIIEKHCLSTGEALEIIIQILDGLSYAHRMGIVHRDIKPENILFSIDGKAKLTDWGIGKFMSSTSVTQTVGTKGTIAYSAPEQLDKRKFGKPDWQTDIFQTGIVFYEMLTNINPFHDEEMVGVMNNILTYAPEAPSTINPDIPHKLDQIVMKALKKQKGDRWRSADVMFYELKNMAEM